MSKIISIIDAETTGASASQDQICAFSIINLDPLTGKREVYARLCKPTIPISEDAMAVHGITNERLLNEPSFAELAPKVMEMIKGNTISGHNILRFDIPLFVYEFKRAGIDWTPDLNNVLDTFVAYAELYPRTLEGVKRFYTGQGVDNAHDARADTDAVASIIPAMMGHHAMTDVSELINLSAKWSSKIVDWEGKLKKDKDGQIIFTFGKYKDMVVSECMRKDQSYLEWLEKTFPGTSMISIIKDLIK